MSDSTNRSRLPQAVLATGPLLLTPVLVYGITEGVVGFGGGTTAECAVLPSTGDPTFQSLEFYTELTNVCIKL